MTLVERVDGLAAQFRLLWAAPRRKVAMAALLGPKNGVFTGFKAGETNFLGSARFKISGACSEAKATEALSISVSLFIHSLHRLNIESFFKLCFNRFWKGE